MRVRECGREQRAHLHDEEIKIFVLLSETDSIDSEDFCENSRLLCSRTRSAMWSPEILNGDLRP